MESDKSPLDDQLFRTLIESIASAVFVFQGEKMCYVNMAAQSLSGYLKDELLAMPFWDIIHEDFQDLVKQRGCSRQAGEVVPDHYEVKIVRKDGEICWVNFHASIIKLGDQPAVLGMAEEITERKQGENRLQQTQNIFELFADYNAMAATLSADDVIQKTLEFLGHTFSTHESSIAIIETGRHSFSLTASTHHEQLKLNQGISIPFHNTVLSEVIQSQQPRYRSDIEAEHPKYEVDKQLLKSGFRSDFLVPLWVENRCLGTLNMGRNEIDAFSNDERELIIMIASRLAQVLHNASLFQALRESEEQYRTLIEDSPDMIHSLDARGRIISANKAELDTMGYSLEEYIGKSALEVVHSDYLETTKNALASVLAGQTIKKYETALVTKAGKKIDVEVSAIPKAVGGKIVAIRAIIRDITERKQAELLTNQTADILEMIATGQPAPKVYAAITHMYEARHLGMRCSILELKGNTLLHGGAPSLPEEYCKAVSGLQNGPSVGSCGTSTYTGKRVLVEDIATDPKWVKLKSVAMPFGLRSCWSEPIKSVAGKVLGAFGMYYNHPALPNEQELNDLASAGRLAGIVMERELREASLRKLTSAIKQAGESIMITDSDGLIEYVNPAFVQLTGYSADEIIGQTPRLLNSGNQDDAFYKEMWDTITGGNIWHGKVIDRKKDGSLYPATLTISPIYDTSEGEGRYSHFVGIQSDLTKIENLEHQFYQAQKMEAIGTLVGGIAHDFNNMLAGMTGNLYLAKKKAQEIPDVVQKLDNIEQLSFRAADMIQQLLAFARKDVVTIKPLPFISFIKETLKFLRSSVPENIEIHQDICTDPLTVKGDATQLHQVLMNVMNNARDALEGVSKPSITIRLEAFQPDEIFAKDHLYLEAGQYAHLSVEDNGCGIPEHQIEHLFEPFFTTKEQGKGTGLGLAMVFGAVKTHKGYVEVESIEGEGSTFHIYIPLLKEMVAVSESSQEDEVVQSKGELILIADDEQHVRETTSEVLESMGYRVLQTEDGLEAIEVLKAHKDEVALAILDVVMPNVGGIELAQRIRDVQPELPVIFATGYDKEYTLGSGKHVQNSEMVTKPFQFEALNRIIRDKLNS